MKPEQEDNAYFSPDAQDIYFHESLGHRELSLEEELSLGKTVSEGRTAQKKLDNSFRLDAKTKKELKQKIAEGISAGDTLIKANQAFVVHIASVYKNLGSETDLMDLIADGNEGLTYAVRVKYDYKRGYKVNTFAAFWIRQKIHRAFADMYNGLRLPSHAHQTLQKILKQYTQFCDTHERSPSTEELSKLTHLPKHKVLLYQKLIEPPISLDSPLTINSNETLGDVLVDQNADDAFDLANKSLAKTAVEELLAHLEEREALVLSLRFGLQGQTDHTLEETGNILHLTRERVRQIQNKAFEKLKRLSITRHLLEQLTDHS